jgi:uncharacterized membrane protein
MSDIQNNAKQALVEHAEPPPLVAPNAGAISDASPFPSGKSEAVQDQTSNEALLIREERELRHIEIELGRQQTTLQRNVYFTQVVLAVVAVLTIVLGSSQVYYARVSTRATKRATEIAQEALDASKKSGESQDIAAKAALETERKISEDSIAAARKNAEDSIASVAENARVQLRPQVAVDIINPPGFLLNDGDQAVAHLSLTNRGHAVASNVTMYSQVFLGPNAMGQADKFFSDMTDKIVINVSKKAAHMTLPPSDQTTDLKYTSALSSRPLGDGESQQLSESDYSVAVIGIIIYTDSSGKFYRTNFCYTRVISGAVPMCKRHNEAR